MALNTNKREGDKLHAEEWNELVQEVQGKQSRLNIVDSLDSTSSADVLSAKQGKVLNDRITDVNTAVENVSDKIDKLPTGIYYGQYDSEEDLEDVQVTTKGYAYISSTDPAVYYIYLYDGNSWTNSGNKFVTTNLETDLSTKSQTKAPTTKVVAEGIEAIDVTLARSAEDENELTKAQKYNASANINDRAAVVADVTGEVQALGYKVLNPNASFASQVEGNSNANMIFEIRDEFNLDPKSINADYAETTWDEYVVINHKRYYYNSSSVIEITPSDSPSGKVILYSKEPSCLLKLNPNVVYKNNAIINQDISAYLALEESTSTTYKIGNESDVTIYLESSPVTISDNDYFLSNAIELSDSEQITVGSRYIIINAAGDTILSSNGSYTASGSVSVKVGKKLIASTITTACSISTCTVIPDNCTLKFNGGRIKNGICIGNFNCEGDYKYTVAEKVFPQGFNYSKVSDVVTASEVGMIEDDSESNTINGNIFGKLVALGKSLILDGKYYIAGRHEINYKLSISGGELWTTSTAFLRPLEGSSIFISNCIIRPQEGIIYKEGLNYLIDRVEVTNCRIDRGFVIRLYDTGADVSVNKIGINHIVIKNNIFNNLLWSPIIITAITYNTFNVSNNIVNGFKGEFIGIGRGNQAVNSNKEYYCDTVVENNIAEGSYINAEYSSYCTFLSCTTNRLFYRNNVIKNIIKTYQTGYPAYDAYANVNEYYCIGNSFKNIVYVPLSGAYTSGDARSEFFKSKGGGKIRLAENNIWEVDFDEVLDIIRANGDTMTESQMQGVAEILLFNFVDKVDKVIFKNNKISIKNGCFAPLVSTVPVVDFLCQGNTFEIDKLSKSGNLFKLGNSVTKKVDISKNYITIDNLFYELYLCGSNYKSGSYSTSIDCNLTIEDNICSRNVYLAINDNVKKVNIENNKFVGSRAIGQIDGVSTSFYASPKEEVSVVETTIICGNAERSIYLNNSTNCINKLHLDFTANAGGNTCIGLKGNPDTAKTNYEVKVTFMGWSKLFRVTYTDNLATVVDENSVKWIDNGTVLVSTSSTLVQRGNKKIEFTPSGSIKITNNDSTEMDVYVESADMYLNYFGLRLDSYSTREAFEVTPKWWNKTKWVDSKGNDFVAAKHTGTTAQRPINLTSSNVGFDYYDTDLNKPIYWNGTAWIDGNGEAVGLQVSDTSVLIVDSPKTVSVYYGGTTAPTITVLNADDSADTWLTATPDPFTGNTLTLTAAANDTSAPRGAKVLVTLGTELVIINVVQSY